MTRYRKIRPAVGVSLFPFLAVLICTMGALIVLLVLVVQMAKVNASEDALVLDEIDPRDAQRMEHEDHVWRRELLEQQRQAVKEDVDKNRLVLSHLEQHIRDLEQRWNRLRDESMDLQLRIQGGGKGQQMASEKLAELQEEIRNAAEELEAAKAEAANRAPVYCIVPYDGPNGTSRRPVYLECTERGVVIQPEGVVITNDCLQGPLGAGNPLDAALRAIREYYVRSGVSLAGGEPYPLLIVRPDGIENYAMARAAMRHWDDEFGYELVDDLMQVKYPEPNPSLAQFLNKVVDDARSRQRILASAMPSRFGRKDDVGFVASSVRGGFVPADGSGPDSRGSRRGGFGSGGDSRYIDGRSSGRQAGSAKPVEDQNVGGSLGQGVGQGAAESQAGQSAAPLAKTRGRNWGLPSATAGATGIVRPLRLACLRDRLILLPDKGERRAPEVVLVEGSMLDEIDDLISKIWDRIDEWGIAVAGGYWKPVLHVDVAQGADSRFEELHTLLDGSGLDVQRNAR